MFGKPGHWLLVVALLLIADFFVFVHWGNNRMAVYFRHRVRLPASAHDIHFTTRPAPIVLTDDWAKCTVRMSGPDFKAFLREQEYQYVVRVDTSCQGQCWSYIMSGYRPVPDSLLDRYPIRLECRSPIGDFLMVGAKRQGPDEVLVHLYTDWN